MLASNQLGGGEACCLCSGLCSSATSTGMRSSANGSRSGLMQAMAWLALPMKPRSVPVVLAQGVRLALASASACSLARRSCSWRRRSASAVQPQRCVLAQGVRLLALARRSCSWRRRSASRVQQQRCVLAQGVRLLLWPRFCLLFGEALLLLAKAFGFRAFSRSDAFLLKAFGFGLGLSFSLLFGEALLLLARRSLLAKAFGFRAFSSSDAFLLKAFGFALASASACSLANRSCSWRLRSASAACWAWRR